MMKDQKDELLQTLLLVEKVKLKAQLRAIKKLASPETKKEKQKPKRMLRIDMVYYILSKSDKPLHISEIIEKVKSLYNVGLDRESIVSAISKKVNKNDRFVRTDKNTFTVLKAITEEEK